MSIVILVSKTFFLWSHGLAQKAVKVFNLVEFASALERPPSTVLNNEAYPLEMSA